MNHRPTDEEIEVALAKTVAGYNLSTVLTAVNIIRDKRIYNEMLEELNLYRKGYKGACYACEPVGELNQKLKLTLKKIINDGVELSAEKVCNQRDYFQKLAREALN